MHRPGTKKNRPEGAGLAGPARASFFRFNELPPIRGGGTEAPFPNGTAKVALFAGFPNFLPVFFRLFRFFFDFPPPAPHFSTFYPACRRLSPRSPGARHASQGHAQGHTASPRDTSPGQATGKRRAGNGSYTLLYIIQYYHTMTHPGPKAATNIFRTSFFCRKFQDKFSSCFLLHLFGFFVILQIISNF